MAICTDDEGITLHCFGGYLFFFVVCALAICISFAITFANSIHDGSSIITHLDNCLDFNSQQRLNILKDALNLEKSVGILMTLFQFILLDGIALESYFWSMYQVSDEFKEYGAERDAKSNENNEKKLDKEEDKDKEDKEKNENKEVKAEKSYGTNEENQNTGNDDKKTDK